MPTPNNSHLEIATFANGCFWCTEAIFTQLRGVEKVVSGYIGGEIPNPSYDAVCTGTTGHAEALQIHFDPEQISYETLLEVFWHTHDPTTLNRQGNDVGTQYRSAIFYHNDEQKQLATVSKALLEESKYYPDPIVTEITAAAEFYPAEDYHQNYYASNQNQPYCSFVITPKLAKLREQYSDKLKN